MAPGSLAPPFEAFFAQPGRHGQRLCVHTLPATALRGVVLHIHAFAEEMNKSRRMVAQASRALAASGFAVLQIDLLGCGDASGDFADATWEDWRADIDWAARWLTQRYDAPLWLWGHRAGALLATASAAQIDRACSFLFWNPVLQGKVLTQQFVRLKTAAEWASGDDGKAAGAWVKAEFAAGRVVEIAGYRLSPVLMQGLDQLALVPPPLPAPGPGSRMVWLEVAGRAGEPTLSPVAQLQLGKWQAAGYATLAEAVSGPAFWQTVEIEDAPDLVDATVRALCTHPVVGPTR